MHLPAALPHFIGRVLRSIMCQPMLVNKVNRAITRSCEQVSQYNYAAFLSWPFRFSLYYALYLLYLCAAQCTGTYNVCSIT